MKGMDMLIFMLQQMGTGTKQYIILMEISKQMDILKSVQLRLEKKLLKILLNEKNFGVVCVLKQKNPSIEHSHTFGVVGYVKEFDPYFNQVVSYPVFGKNNTELEEQINIVEQQAIDNYEKNNR